MLRRLRRMGVKAICLFALSGSILPAASAQQKNANHTLDWGEGIYRIELVELGPLFVRSTGDPRSDGELHRVIVSLEELPGNAQDYPSRQLHSFTYFNGHAFHNSRSSARRESTYMEIRENDWISMRTHGEPANAQHLWIHIRPSAPLYRSELISFKVVVYAKELDCRGTNVCRRFNEGKFEFSVRMPLPSTNVPYHCGTSNTYDVLPIDGKLALAAENTESYGNRGGSRSRGAFTQDRYYTSDGNGPVLTFQNAKICIARTTRAPWPGLPPSPEEAAEERQRQLARGLAIIERD